MERQQIPGVRTRYSRTCTKAPSAYLIFFYQDPLTGGESEEEEEVVDVSGGPATAMSRLSSTESDLDDPSVALLSAHGTPPAGYFLHI